MRGRKGGREKECKEGRNEGGRERGRKIKYISEAERDLFHPRRKQVYRSIIKYLIKHLDG